jgi:hypothetical protein
MVDDKVGVGKIKCVQSIHKPSSYIQKSKGLERNVSYRQVIKALLLCAGT